MMFAKMNHANITALARREVRTLDGYKRIFHEESRTSCRALPLRLRNRSRRPGFLAPQRPVIKLRLLEARANGDNRQRDTLERFTWPEQAPALPALETSQATLLRPGEHAIRVVWRPRYRDVRAMDQRCRRVHRLDRAEPRPAAVASTFNQPDRQRRRLRAREPGLGYTKAASAKPASQETHSLTHRMPG